jgi:RNA polymerase sigma-70 factor (ECF subfamily)
MNKPIDSAQEQQWLIALGKGDRSAFQSVYDTHWQAVYRLAAGILRDSDRAEEATQDVFVSLWMRRERLNIRGPLSAYLKQSVKYTAYKALREVSKLTELTPALEQVDTNPSPHEIIAFEELQERYHRKLISLPEKQRQVFLLHREQSLTYLQIAQELGVSLKTVEARMSKALRFLSLHLRQYLFLFFL